MKKWFFSAIFGLTSLIGSANGVLTIQGTLKSIARDQYVIETAHSVYFIRRSAVSASDAKKISKTDVPITLSVPFEGIEVVKPRKVAKLN